MPERGCDCHCSDVPSIEEGKKLEIEKSTPTKTGTRRRKTGRRRTRDSFMDAELPEEMKKKLGRFVGKEDVETLDDWVREVRDETGGGSIGVEDLCHADEETPHRGEIDGETYHFVCFYDAVVLSEIADSPVDIRTESPEGKVIKARADGEGGLEVIPSEAVFSFGVSVDGIPSGDESGDPTHEDVYSAICPYVRAFADRDEYERWDARVDAVTVAAPLEGATELARRLVG